MARSTFIKEFWGNVGLWGQDSSGNEDPLRTNDNQQLQVEVVAGTGKVLGSADDLTSETVLYTVPASTEATVDKIVIVNRHTDTVRIDLGHSEGGGALANIDYLIFDHPLPARGVLTFEGPIYMDPTDELRGDISGNSAVNVRVYGREIAT